MKISQIIIILGFLLSISCNSSKKSFDDQMKTFNSLGYDFNAGVDKKLIYEEWHRNSYDEKTLDSLIANPPFERLYYILGSGIYQKPTLYRATDNCIWWDIEFIDPASQYIYFMELMGKITQGEITFSEIKIIVDDLNFEWIHLKVNGKEKKWKLAKEGSISDSFFQRFSYLPEELNTKGKYTYYDDGGQQFVIDYATNKEQKKFIRKTGLNREWLGEGNHFREPEE